MNKLLLTIMLGYSNISYGSGVMENIAAVLSSRTVCGFSVNQDIFQQSLNAMGVRATDITPGGIYRDEFDYEVQRIKRLTSTESGRQSYCDTLELNLSAFFDDSYTASLANSSDREVVKIYPEIPTWSNPGRPGMEPETEVIENKFEIKLKNTETVAQPSAEVQRVQSRLIALKYNPGPSDGLIGVRTVEAISLFKSINNMPVNGEITKELIGKLDEKIGIINQAKNQARQKNSIDSVIGSTVENTNIIERVQSHFSENDLYNGPKDGVMNTLLENAIIRYQVENRLSADGKATEALLKK